MSTDNALENGFLFLGTSPVYISPLGETTNTEDNENFQLVGTSGSQLLNGILCENGVLLVFI